ncbi:MAG: Rho termination factor N-terminal domain-containing protein [Firmicutes bacterium]|nr:Rho termination factor N-terminal domain-containing protein [Bacillota bacterium]
MKVSELRDLAKEKGLSGYSTLKKAELVDLLKQA